MMVQILCDHVETLIQSNLGELGITTYIFIESCTKARNTRIAEIEFDSHFEKSNSLFLLFSFYVLLLV